MAFTTLDQLDTLLRQKTNTENSNICSRSERISYLNEALRELREKIVSADDSYYSAHQDYSVGAYPANVAALPADFWMARAVKALAGTVRERDVFAREARESNRPGIGYMFGGTGNDIVFLPQFTAQSGNPWRLIYTPKPIPLADTVIRTPAWTTGDHSGAGVITVAAGNFQDGDVTITLGGGSGADGVYTILEVFAANQVEVSPSPGTLTFANTTTYSVTNQPPGTRNTLDTTEDAYAEYLPVRAGVQVARKKRQDSLVDSLGAERAAIEARIQLMAAKRQGEPQQAPVEWGRFHDRARYAGDYFASFDDWDF